MLFSQKDKEIMSLALNEAREAGKQGNFPIGGALAINGNPIDTGRNQLYVNGDWYSHAENRLIEKHSKLILEEIKKLSVGNEKLLKTVKELDSRLKKSEEEQSKLIQNLKAAVGTLPARHQRKFANLTG